MDSLVDKGRNTTLSTDKNLLKPEYTNYSSKSTELHDTSIGRHKSPWTWNGLDSETLSGNTVSKGADKPFEIKTNISDKTEYVSKAIQGTNNIG